MKLFVSVILSLFAANTSAANNLSRFDALKAAAVKKVIADANDPQSVVGAAIAVFNLETDDGRNPGGALNLPITEDIVQATIVTAENIYRSWHYAERIGNTCKSSDLSATILITVLPDYGVHSAIEYDGLHFLVNVNQELSFTTTDTSTEESWACEAEVLESKEGLKDYKAEILVSEPRKFEIPMN